MSPLRRKHLAILGCLILVIGIATGYLINNLEKSNTGNAQSGTTQWKEPPALTNTLTTYSDYMNDLESLGCPLIHTTQIAGAAILWLEVYNYTEFRRMAFNSKVVLYDGISFDIPFNGIMLVFEP